NEFEGSIFWDHTGHNWRTATPAEEAAGGRKTRSKEEQYGAFLGGPIIEDRLHFFVSYEAKEYNTPRTVTLGTGNYDPDAVPAEFLTMLGPTSSPFRQDMYFGKLSWSPDDRNLVE